MNEKKPISPILVILAIVFLAVFIVVPPLFRVMYPVEVEEPMDTAHILTCTRVSIKNNYLVTNKVTYNNDSPTKNVVTFDPYVPTDDDMANADVNELAASDELAIFSNNGSITVAEEAGKFTLTLTPEVMATAGDAGDVSNYFLPSSSEQQTYLAGIGYSCSIVEL